MISQVTIIPGCGYEHGKFNPGHGIGNVLETDLVNEVTRCLHAELELENIRVHMVETRERPGFVISERHKQIPDNSLVLHVRSGWYERVTAEAHITVNGSAIYYTKSGDLPLAEIILEAMGEWGRCSVYGHQKSKPKLDKDDPVLKPLAAKMSAFRIEPFAINGVSIDDYWRRIPQLGRDLAIQLSYYLKDQGYAMMREPKAQKLKKEK
jgi:hypothetical protein